MTSLTRLLVVPVLLLVLGAGGQVQFHAVTPGRLFQFPRDHGAHREFKTEWWYYSGHLTAASGDNFGYQLTFFRVGLTRPRSSARSAWTAREVYFAHMALTAPHANTFLFREKAGRGAMGLAGAEESRLKVWIDDWRAEVQGEEHHLSAGDDEVALDLFLTPVKPPVLHGQGGYSRKSAMGEAASYYYSVTRLATRGTVTFKNRRHDVTGESWLDREFSTGQMPPHLAGWDWFALQLSDGTEIMLYLLRRPDGSLDEASAGTLVDPQGHPQHLRLADFQVRVLDRWKSPHSGAIYPSQWEIAIHPAHCSLKLTPIFPDQELRTGGTAHLIYWEGQVSIQGKKGPEPISGRGYVELTGYAGALGGRF